MVEKSAKWVANGYAADLIGGAWLSSRYGVDPVQPLRYVSRIAKTRATLLTGNTWATQYQEAYRPEPTLAGHLGFMLRHERVHLEFLSRLYAVIDPVELADWANRQPTGRYMRRAGFLYEWLTGRRLDFGGVTQGTYVDALENDLYFTATSSTNNARWRVRDNMPGTKLFCPTILLTDEAKVAQDYDIAARMGDLQLEFGEDLLARSVVWLTIKESRSSFAIEGEQDAGGRIRRFAAVMETEVGRHESPPNVDTLTVLQRSILGDSATRYGVRESPVFVGETRGADEVIHYIAPHWKSVIEMLAGLEEADIRTRGRNSLIRAAALSFGFVYIHPFSDGNGRISRFLINDVLRRDGVLPAPYVLPVSAVMSGASRDYDRVLESLSRPFMRRYQFAYRFGPNKLYEDGMWSNFEFDGYTDAEPTWRYPDLTDHVIYLHDVVRLTIEQEMRQEARQMRTHHRARASLNEVIEGSDQELDRIIRSVTANRRVTGVLQAEFPTLTDANLASRVGRAVLEAMDDK